VTTKWGWGVARRSGYPMLTSLRLAWVGSKKASTGFPQVRVPLRG
jgi:hypothetical protein